jgi:hypothetical protein
MSLLRAPRPLRPLHRFIRRAAALVPTLPLAAVAQESGQPVPAATPEPAPALALFGDFIERGPMTGPGDRSMAVVDLVNATQFRLTVALGQGTARLEPEDLLHLRAEPGTVHLRADRPAGAAGDVR